MTSCSSVEIYERFGGTYCLHLQSTEISQKQTKLIVPSVSAHSPRNGIAVVYKEIRVAPNNVRLCPSV
jgi:hypothetical protein